MKRNREVMSLIKQAGVELIGGITVTGANHLKAVCRNPAGHERFFLFALTPSDRRGDLQNLSQLRRFARATELARRNSLC